MFTTLLRGYSRSPILTVVLTSFPVGFMANVTFIMFFLPPFNTVPALIDLNVPVLVVAGITWFYATILVCSGIADGRMLIASTIYRLLAVVVFALFVANISIYTQASNDTTKLSSLFSLQLGAVLGFGLTSQLYKSAWMISLQQPRTRIVTQVMTVPHTIVVVSGDQVANDVPVATVVPSWNFFRPTNFMRFA